MSLKLNSSGGGSVIISETTTAYNHTFYVPGQFTALTDGATITPDFADNLTFTVGLGGNRTIANPANMVPGQTGCIIITQDATGGRTLAWGSYWKWQSGGTPILTSTANAVDRVDFIVVSTTNIQAVFTGNYS